MLFRCRPNFLELLVSCRSLISVDDRSAMLGQRKISSFLVSKSPSEEAAAGTGAAEGEEMPAKRSRSTPTATKCDKKGQDGTVKRSTVIMPSPICKLAGYA